MTENDKVLRIRRQAREGNLRLTQHAQQEMIEEAIRLEDVLDAIGSGTILEDYPEHRRGACCLLGGLDASGRHIHIVCTSNHDPLIVITAYLPRPPKWLSPTQRRPRQ